MKQDGGWRRSAWAILALTLGLSGASMAQAEPHERDLGDFDDEELEEDELRAPNLRPAAATCAIRGATYTVTGETCSDDPYSVAYCAPGETVVSETVTELGLTCGRPPDRWHKLKVTRQCKKPDTQGPCPKRAAQLKDFDNDGKSDVLWHRPSDGVVSIWYGGATPGTLNGTGNLSWQAGDAGGWAVVGTGHFNSDNFLDVLWYNAGRGQLSAWFLDGTQVVVGDAFLSRSALSGFKVVGTGDFNRDGKTDVLWHHPQNGTLTVWYLDGTAVTGSADLSWSTKETDGWKVRGTGDFDADGNVDVLWHHAGTGHVGAWFMSGVTVRHDAFFSWPYIGTDWELVGTGDYSQDGKLDLLWYHAGDGILSSWNLNGMTVTGKTDFITRVPQPRTWRAVSR